MASIWRTASADSDSAPAAEVEIDARPAPEDLIRALRRALLAELEELGPDAFLAELRQLANGA